MRSGVNSSVDANAFLHSLISDGPNPAVSSSVYAVNQPCHPPPVFTEGDPKMSDIRPCIHLYFHLE